MLSNVRVFITNTPPFTSTLHHPYVWRESTSPVSIKQHRRTNRMDVLRLTTVGLLVLLALGCVNTVLGQAVTKHLEAAIIKPVMRSAMWAYLGNAVYADQLRTAVNYDYFSRLHCGGKLTTENDYEQKCGPCGDAFDSSRPNEYGGKYSIRQVVAVYHEGSQINVTIDLRHLNNPGGTFRFSLCETNDTTIVSHDCFRKHELSWHDTKIIRIPAPTDVGLATYTLQLPAGVTCQYCVLQWKFRDGTSTSDPECEPPGSTNCGQRTITNCADVRIIDQSQAFPADFDRPRYDDYASIFRATDEDNHGEGVHVPRSTLIDTPSIVPGTGSTPIIIGVPGGTSPTNPSSGDDDKLPETSAKLIGGAVLPASVGTLSIISGQTGIGIALLLLAWYMHSSQQLSHRSGYFGSPTSPNYNLPVPVSYQSYINPGGTSLQNSGSWTPMYQGPASTNPQSTFGGQVQQGFNTGTFQQPVFTAGGIGQNTFFGASGIAQGPIINSGNIGPSAFFDSSGITQGQLFDASGTGQVFSNGINLGSQGVFPNNMVTSVSSFGPLSQTAANGIGGFQQSLSGFPSVPVSSTSVLGTPQLSGNFNNRFTTIPNTNNGFSTVSQQPQFNPSQQQFFSSSGVPVTGTTIMQGQGITPQIQAQSQFRTALNNPNAVFAEFDEEPRPIRERELSYLPCECRPPGPLLIMTLYCQALSSKECRNDEICFCEQDQRRWQSEYHKLDRPSSSFNRRGI